MRISKYIFFILSVILLSARCTQVFTLDPSTVDLSPYTDLSAEGTANCYLVQAAGKYKFKAVKGNSTESVGAAQSAKVLWETFGTSTTPNVGDLVTDAVYKDDYIYFSTPATFNNGNASIAVYDANGTILWSWHIWCSAEGWNDHVYKNNAGTMMDRNLGATSATPGNVGALGLMYQWGRKDPFLSSSSISANIFAESTGTWGTVWSKQTVEYVTANPVTFIAGGDSEWCTGYGNSTKRWLESEKTMYDPCPVGYRVPKGGSSGFWSTALGTSSATSEGTTWDDTDKGRHWTLADGTTAWYPAVGYRSNVSGSLSLVGEHGYCWSASPSPSSTSYAYYLNFNCYGNVYPAYDYNRGSGYSVRCVQDIEVVPEPDEPADVDLSLYADLSAEGTANCYLVQAVGKYRFKAVKGNSTESVGAAQSAKVLWETFGTDGTPNVGELVAYAGYKDDYIYFSTPATFNNGNASIAVCNAKGTILWSWHIWCSAEGWSDHVYKNNAGTMMDRNLGATSATPGNVGALGLLYQWGRKDPFIGSGDILTNTVALSTGTWETVSGSRTVDYAIENPMTYITDYDWCSNAWDNYEIRWKESEKSLYDPCPIGYRIPKGGESGFWATALGTSSSTSEGTTWDDTNKGRNWPLADGTTAWYPAVGYRRYNIGSLDYVGESGYCWSASPDPSYTKYAYYLSFLYNGIVSPANDFYRGYGFSVRCVRE